MDDPGAGLDADGGLPELSVRGPRGPGPAAPTPFATEDCVVRFTSRIATWVVAGPLAVIPSTGACARPRLPAPETAAATRPAGTSARRADEQEIRALIARYGAAANARDLPAVMRGYAETDALLVYDVSNKPFRGFAEVTRDWRQFFAAMRAIDLQFRDVEVTVDEPGAFAYATFIERAALTPREGAPFVNDNLRTTQVYRKLGGRWLIVHEHKSKSRAE